MEAPRREYFVNLRVWPANTSTSPTPTVLYVQYIKECQHKYVNYNVSKRMQTPTAAAAAAAAAAATNY